MSVLQMLLLDHNTVWQTCVGQWRPERDRLFPMRWEEECHAFNRQLDWLIVAGTDEDDVAAIPRVIERYPPDAVLWSGNDAGFVLVARVE